MLRSGRNCTRTLGSIWFKHLAALILKALGMHISSKAKQRDIPVVNAFPLVSLLFYGVDHFSLPIFWCLPKRPVNWHIRVSQWTPLLRPSKISCQITWQSAVFPVFSVFDQCEDFIRSVYNFLILCAWWYENGWFKGSLKYYLHQSTLTPHCWQRHASFWWI